MPQGRFGHIQAIHHGLEFGLREIEENVARNFISEDSQLLEDMTILIKEKGDD